MRIGILTGEYPPLQGGVGAYSRILAHELARQNHSVAVISTQAAREADPMINLSPAVARWGWSALRAARRWAQAHHLDVVNLQYQTAAYQMSPWIHFLPEAIQPTPVVTTFHDLRVPYLFPKAGPLRNWMVMRLARASAGVIATNDEDFARLSGLPCAALVPIGSNILSPLPANFDPQPWRAQAGAGMEDFLIAYFGLFNRSKGLDVLLKSVSQLRADGVPARLLLIGGGAGSSDPTNLESMRHLEALIGQLELGACIGRTGYLEDEAQVGAFLAASDAVALPFVDGASFRRGSLMAAIHYGCAIVTTAPAVPVPAFVDGDNLLLAPANDVQALAEALHRLWDSPALRARLRAGAARLAGSFTWPKIAQACADCFACAIEKSDRA